MENHIHNSNVEQKNIVTNIIIAFNFSNIWYQQWYYTVKIKESCFIISTYIYMRFRKWSENPFHKCIPLQGKYFEEF